MKNNTTILPVIMAGGIGSRLWPLSRNSYPKQFLTLFGENTMLQETVHRLNGLECEAPLVICNNIHRFIAAEQLMEIGIQKPNILLEPSGKNTAPAIALAAFEALKKDNDSILLVLPADHIINGKAQFQETIKQSLELAINGNLVTFGIIPVCAETAYGYIKKGTCLTSLGYNISSFVEKPDKRNAEKYFMSGEYYWNSGMFLFKASCYLKELNKYRPDIYHFCKAAINEKEVDLNFIRINSDIFNSCPSESIDYAVMEKTEKAVVVPLQSEWSDVGSFPSLWEHSLKDANGNHLKGDVFVKNVFNSYIVTDKKIVAAVGVDNLIVVNTPDALLVVNKERCNELKDLISMLKQENREELNFNSSQLDELINRQYINKSEFLKINKFSLKKNGKFNSKKEDAGRYLLVLSGFGTIEFENVFLNIEENSSIYIPKNTQYLLKNTGGDEFYFIEFELNLIPRTLY